MKTVTREHLDLRKAKSSRYLHQKNEALWIFLQYIFIFIYFFLLQYLLVLNYLPKNINAENTFLCVFCGILKPLISAASLVRKEN